MNVGKLYQVKKYFWLLYPSKEIADAHVFASLDTTAAAAAAYYSKEYNCNVSYISPKSIFCFLEQNEKFIKILSTNGELGWIYLSDFYKDKDDIEEVNQ
jgi:hypothetical protein